MQEFFTQLLNSLKKLGPLQKASLVGAVFLVILIVVILIVMKGEANYAVLFSNVDPKTAGVIVKKIKELGEKYKYDANNSTIYVPADRKGEIFLNLSAEGILPQRGESFDSLFEKQGMFGVSKSRERIDIIRGLQGEIERMITKINGIEYSEVRLVLPEEKVFKEDQEPARASVLIKMEPLATLKPHQIKGIINMVAYSVPGLDPKNVKIVDSTGKDLTESIDIGEESAGGTNNKRMTFKREYEKQLEIKAKNILENLMGPGKVVVKVTAELNFDRIERKIKNISTPVEGEEKGVPVSQQQKTEAYEGNAPIPAGVPGTKTNVPTYKSKTGEKNNKYQKTETITNYDYNQIYENHVIAPGDVKRLSVAVAIDGNLDEKTEEKYKELVKSAVGFDASRGDKISFVAHPFDRSYWEKQMEEREKQKQAEKQRLLILSIISFLIIVVVPLFFKIVKIYKEKKLEEARREEEARRLAARRKILEPVLSVEEQERKDKQDRIKQHVMEKPEEAAQIIRMWLNEE